MLAVHVMSGPMPACGCRTYCPVSGDSSYHFCTPIDGSRWLVLLYVWRGPLNLETAGALPPMGQPCSKQLFSQHVTDITVSRLLRDGETEMVSDALEQQPAQVKLLYAGSAAGIIILGASAVCWLTGNDLLGGASLSPHSLKAAEVHALPVIRRISYPDIIQRLWSTSHAHVSGALLSIRFNRSRGFGLHSAPRGCCALV